MNKKICPMLSKYIWENVSDADKGLHDVECKEEKCAWWDLEKKRCAINVIAQSLIEINKYGIVIFSKRLNKGKG